MAHTNETTSAHLSQSEFNGSVKELAAVAANQENGESKIGFGLDGARRVVRDAISKAALIGMGVGFALGISGCTEDNESNKPVPGLQNKAASENDDGEFGVHHKALTADGMYYIGAPKLAAFDDPNKGVNDLDTKEINGEQFIFFTHKELPSYVEGKTLGDIKVNKKIDTIQGLDEFKGLYTFAVSKSGKIILQGSGVKSGTHVGNIQKINGSLHATNVKKLPANLQIGAQDLIFITEGGEEYLYWHSGNKIQKVKFKDLLAGGNVQVTDTGLDSDCELPQMYLDKDGKTELWLASKGYKVKDKQVCEVVYGKSFEDVIKKTQKIPALNKKAYNNTQARVVGHGKPGEFVILLKYNGEKSGAHPYTAEILEYCGNDQCGDNETPQNCAQDCKVDDKDAGSTQPDVVSDKDAGSDASDTSQDAGSDAGVDAGSTDTADTSQDAGSDTTDAGVDAGTDSTDTAPDSKDTSQDTETDTSKDTEKDAGADSADSTDTENDSSSDAGVDATDTGSDSVDTQPDTKQPDTHKDTADTPDTTKPAFEPITVANKDCKISIKKTQKGALEGYRVSVDAEKIVESCLADIEVAGFKAKAQINAINKDGAIHMHCIFLKDGADVTCYGELDTLLDLDEDKHGIKVAASESPEMEGVYTVSSASRFSSVLELATDGSGDRILVITPEEGDLNIFGGKFFELLQFKAEDFKGIKLQINVDKATIREGDGEERPLDFTDFPDGGTQVDIKAQTDGGSDAGAKPDQVNKTDGVAQHDGGTSTDTGYRKPPVDDGCSASLQPGQRSTLPMAIMSMLTILGIATRRRKKRAEVK